MIIILKYCLFIALIAIGCYSRADTALTGYDLATDNGTIYLRTFRIVVKDNKMEVILIKEALCVPGERAIEMRYLEDTNSGDEQMIIIGNIIARCAQLKTRAATYEVWFSCAAYLSDGTDKRFINNRQLDSIVDELESVLCQRANKGFGNMDKIEVEGDFCDPRSIDWPEEQFLGKRIRIKGVVRKENRAILRIEKNGRTMDIPLKSVNLFSQHTKYRQIGVRKILDASGNFEVVGILAHTSDQKSFELGRVSVKNIAATER